MEFEVGNKIRFKNMPITYPKATVVWVNENRTLKFKLESELTRMGYPKTEKDDQFVISFNETHSKANTVKEGTCSFDDVERI